MVAISDEMFKLSLSLCELRAAAPRRWDPVRRDTGRTAVNERVISVNESASAGRSY